MNRESMIFDQLITGSGRSRLNEITRCVAGADPGPANRPETPMEKMRHEGLKQAHRFGTTPTRRGFLCRPMR